MRNSNVAGIFLSRFTRFDYPHQLVAWLEVKVALIAVVIAYLSLILFIPALNVFYASFCRESPVPPTEPKGTSFFHAQNTVLIA